MEFNFKFWILCLTASGFVMLVGAVDPNYLHRAKILSREEIAHTATKRFEPSAKKCAKIGEKAARKKMACMADTQFDVSLANRVHNIRLALRKDKELKELAYKISKCSHKYSKYFERSCKSKTTYLTDRHRCRRLRSRQERTQCKGEIRKRYHTK